MNEELTKEVSEEEVTKVVFQLRAFKAPGLDGFSGIFLSKILEYYQRRCSGGNDQFLLYWRNVE